MKETRFHIRISLTEKKALKEAADNIGMNLSDYVRYRLFENNAEIGNEPYVYEVPRRSKHKYCTIITILDVYYLLQKLVISQNGIEDATTIINRCRELAKETGVKYGYLKVDAKDE